MNKIRNEIVATVGMIRLLLASTIGVLEGFGIVHWSPFQIGPKNPQVKTWGFFTLYDYILPFPVSSSPPVRLLG